MTESLLTPTVARTREQHTILTAMAARGAESFIDFDFGEEEDVLAVGNTSIIRFWHDPTVGHWRLEGAALSL